MLNCKDCKYMRISHYGGMYCYHPKGTTGDLSHRNTPPRWCPLGKYCLCGTEEGTAENNMFFNRNR